MDFPIVIVNGGTTPYAGTVVSGYPMPAGVLFNPIDIVALALDGSGTVHRAGHHILTRHPDGSAKWVLTGVQGTFKPGESNFMIVPNTAGHFDQGIRNEYFIPHMPATTSGAYVRYVEFSTGTEKEWLLDFANLGLYYSRVSYATEVMMAYEWWGDITSTLGWRIFCEIRKGEPGIRVEFQLENRGKGKDDGGKPQIIKEASIWHLQDKPAGEAPVFAWGEQFKAGDARYGALTVAHGKECCPLEMGYSDVHGVVYARWITPETRVPQGGNYAKLAMPGETRNLNDGQQWPQSDWGDFIYEKRSVTVFISGGDDQFIPQEHLDHPPMGVWRDCERYEDALIGGISPVEPWKDASGKPLDQRTLQRFERRAAAAWDPDACTPGHAGNPGERITRTRFRERGGTYERTPDQNPMYGSANYGDMQWGDGKCGAAHYDIDHALEYQFLRSRDFRAWKEAAIATRHLRTVDFQWAMNVMGEDTQQQHEGLVTYEKGQFHGNYGLGHLTHTWLNGAGLAYCLTGHPEYLRMMQQAASHLVKYETLDGAPVPAHWKRGTTQDPRDWGVTSKEHRYGKDNGGSAAWGYQGDWGERRIGRAFEVATAIKVYVGSEVSDNMDAYYLRVLGNVERIETGIWGGNGYILNRAQRSGHRYDYSQLWMLCYVLRGIGYALIYGPPEAQLMYRGLYDRVYSCVLSSIVYGAKDPVSGNYTPPWATGILDESGPIVVTRFGIMPATVSLWYPWRDSVLKGRPSQAAFDAWKTSVIADYNAMLGYTAPAGQYAWLLDDPGFELYMDIVNRVAYDVDQNHADFVYLKSKQWAYTTDGLYPNVNHCAIAADALAQGALELGREDGEVMAVRLAEHVQWRLQGGIKNPVADIRANASPVGWRMSQYPNSESKVNGNQLEDRYSRRILGNMDKLGPIWDESMADIPPEGFSDPWDFWVQASLSSIAVDANGRIDVVSADPSQPGIVPVITDSILAGHVAPIFVDDQS